MTKERIQKIIANSGYCSRRAAEDLIKNGLVKVNGKVINIGATGEKTDKITVEGNLIKPKKKFTYVVLNKPRGYVSAVTDDFEKPVQDLLSEEIKNEKVYPCGRLDKDAQGLLIFTNNGDIANKIMHPSFNLSKTYLVKTYSPVKKEIIDFVNKYGISIKDGYVEAKIRSFGPKTMHVTIHIGYHKVVKKIFDKFGIRVQALTRLQVGNIKIGNIKKGEFRLFTKNEINYIENLNKKLTPKKINRKELFDKERLSEKEFKKLSIIKKQRKQETKKKS